MNYQNSRFNQQYPSNSKKPHYTKFGNRESLHTQFSLSLQFLLSSHLRIIIGCPSWLPLLGLLLPSHIPSKTTLKKIKCSYSFFLNQVWTHNPSIIKSNAQPIQPTHVLGYTPISTSFFRTIKVLSTIWASSFPCHIKQ